MRHLRSSLAALFTPFALSVVAGCASDDAGRADPDATAAAPTAPRPTPVRTQPELTFAPLDLPTPNLVRLGSGAPGPAYWQQQVDYAIDASLDTDARRLTADMTVTYHNNAPDALDYLWIQLEQNLFRTDSLGTITRTGGVMAPLEEPFEGGYDIEYVRAGGQTLELVVYDTLGRLELPEPIAPGETFVFDLGFAFDMPPYLRRMGAEDVEQGTIFEYAQWFPHVCVYDDVHGWNTLPYMGTGEFYTNFGDYQVAITLPREFLVAASGVLTNADEVLTPEQVSRLATARSSPETVMIRTAEEVGDLASRPEGEGPLTWRFRGEDIRTFAFAASQAFVWDACAATVIDPNGAEPRTVLCQSMYPVEAEAWFPDAEQGGSSQYVKHAIEYYSEWLHPYPWPQMTNVNGPEGGMEYPMIVFCGGRQGRGPFGVTDHEVGHSWFPMLVNTDERRHIWMDEGFNTFINMYSSAAFREREPSPGRARGQTLDAARGERRQAVATPPDRMVPGFVGRLGYRKTGMGLYLLREVVLGPERFDVAFGEYVRRWAFKSPQPADFFRTMDDAAGADLAWFWRQWFYETGVLDQAVFVERGDEGAVVTVFNLGEQVMPLTVEIEYNDGEIERRVFPVDIWAYTDERVIEVGNREPVRVVVDPEDVLPDVDAENNVWESEGAGQGSSEGDAEDELNE